MKADDPTEERDARPTPNGGVSSVCYYRDGGGNPAPKSEAVAGEIHELDADGNSVFRTYFELRPKGGAPSETS